LYHYDNLNLDHYSLKEWSAKLPLKARAVSKIGDHLGYQACEVIGYNPEN